MTKKKGDGTLGATDQERLKAIELKEGERLERFNDWESAKRAVCEARAAHQRCVEELGCMIRKEPAPLFDGKDEEE